MNPYASLDQFFTYGIPSNAQGTLTTSQIQGWLDASANEADDYLRGRYSLPVLPPIPLTLTEHVCKIAAWKVCSFRGFDPRNPGDIVIRDNWVAALAWFDKVQRGAIHPAINPSPDVGPSPTQHVRPAVLSSSVVNLATGASARNRGW